MYSRAGGAGLSTSEYLLLCRQAFVMYSFWSRSSNHLHIVNPMCHLQTDLLVLNAVPVSPITAYKLQLRPLHSCRRGLFGTMKGATCGGAKAAWGCAKGACHKAKEGCEWVKDHPLQAAGVAVVTVGIVTAGVMLTRGGQEEVSQYEQPKRQQQRSGRRHK